MATTKFSRQRETIKDYLRSTTDHPTADMVYMSVRKTFPNISLGTVYRNLNFLAERGEILKLTCGDGSDHFDGDTHTHNHFICRNCNRVMDLEMESIEHINVIASANFTGTIEGHHTVFYGLCPDCKTMH